MLWFPMVCPWTLPGLCIWTLPGGSQIWQLAVTPRGLSPKIIFQNSTGLFKGNLGNSRTMSEICSKLVLKTPERGLGQNVVLVSLETDFRHCSDDSVVDFEQVNAGWDSPILNFYALKTSEKLLVFEHFQGLQKWNILIKLGLYYWGKKARQQDYQHASLSWPCVLKLRVVFLDVVKSDIS